MLPIQLVDVSLKPFVAAIVFSSTCWLILLIVSQLNSVLPYPQNERCVHVVIVMVVKKKLPSPAAAFVVVAAIVMVVVEEEVVAVVILLILHHQVQTTRHEMIYRY